MFFQTLKYSDRYALYQYGILVKTNSRKDSVTRLLEKGTVLDN